MAFAVKTKPPVNRKKRSGTHRKHNQQYLKHYWPYLPLLMIVAAGLLCNMLWPAGAQVLGSRSDLTSTSLTLQTNQQRQTHHETPLTPNAQLSAAAEAKARDMAAANYWSHVTPDGRTPWSFIESAGYSYAAAGENLAYGFSDAEAAVTAWMNSPEHRRNILDSSYSQVGFGIASAANYVGKGPQTILVALYAKPATTALAVPTAAGNGPSAVKGATSASLPVSRVALVAGSQAQLMTVLMMVAAGLAVCIFVTRHARLLHRSLVRGEVFVQQHPLFDAAIVVVATAGFVLSHATAFIL